MNNPISCYMQKPSINSELIKLRCFHLYIQCKKYIRTTRKISLENNNKKKNISHKTKSQ